MLAELKTKLIIIENTLLIKTQEEKEIQKRNKKFKKSRKGKKKDEEKKKGESGNKLYLKDRHFI